MARAPINPATLSWAREIGHVTVEDLARSGRQTTTGR